MFTGLIEEVGKIRTVRPRGDGATLTIAASTILEGLQIGDSVAISGPCQTVVSFDRDSFTVEAVKETMERTRFGSWKPGTPVNLERAMRPMDRLGGHLVQGHVDGLVKVKDIRQITGSWRLRFEQLEDGRQFVVEKGSVCLDGVSLTVASTDKDGFEVEIIPHTWEHTTLHSLSRGDQVHVEWDIIAKYVRHMLTGYTGKENNSITMETLIRSGF